MTEIITLENDLWRVGLVPRTGGSIAFGQVRIGGDWVDVMRPTADEDLGTTFQTSSYPLVPWSNRIRDAVMKWQGRAYQLRRNYPDGTAIHGTGTDYPWTIVEQTETRVVLEFASRDFYGVNFPWTFTARFTYALEAERFTCTMTVTNTDHETFPAGLGHHPFFVRTLTDTDGAPLSEEALLQVNCDKGYDLKDFMAHSEAGDIRPPADFREKRGLGTTFVDDCLTGRTSGVLGTIEYPGVLTVDMEADALVEHAVVYIPEEKPFFAFEPVTNANDAFRLDDEGVNSVGLFLVQPGETRSAEFSLVARPH